jgi:coenzyme F420 hydrogenase subunit beta
MKRFESLSEIVSHGYCLSCGLCTQVVDGIEMALTTEDQLRPRPSRRLTPDDEARIVAICPGISVTGPFGDDLAFPDPVWGDVRTTHEGWATDPETRFRASAGGVMTAINRYLLESGRAAFILQARAGGGDALASEGVMIRDPDDLLTGSQSRYAPSAPLDKLNDALATGEPFAVSLKPCDIAGVRNFQRLNPDLADRIVFTMAMFCGTVPSRETSWQVLRRQGIDNATDPPESFRWRGYGCPGPAVATFPDGRQVTATYNQMWNEDRWTTQFRCKICPDAIGLQADIATGDFWPGAVPKGETPGENAIISHTALGAEVLADAAAAGYLTLKSTDLATIADTQPHHVRLRQTWSARVAAASVAGAPVPEFRDLAAADCAAMLEARDIAATFEGTLERARAGQGDEASEFDDWTSTS